MSTGAPIKEINSRQVEEGLSTVLGRQQLNLMLDGP